MVDYRAGTGREQEEPGTSNAKKQVVKQWGPVERT